MLRTPSISELPQMDPIIPWLIARIPSWLHKAKETMHGANEGVETYGEYEKLAHHLHLKHPKAETSHPRIKVKATGFTAVLSDAIPTLEIRITVGNRENRPLTVFLASVPYFDCKGVRVPNLVSVEPFQVLALDDADTVVKAELSPTAVAALHNIPTDTDYQIPVSIRLIGYFKGKAFLYVPLPQTSHLNGHIIGKYSEHVVSENELMLAMKVFKDWEKQQKPPGGLHALGTVSTEPSR